MPRIFLILILVGVVLLALNWAWKWIQQNKVKVRITRPPTRNEIFILTAVFQVVRRLIRLFFKI